MYTLIKKMFRNVTTPTNSKFWVGMFIVLLSFTQLQPLEAQTTWVGGTSTAWATAANWSPATVPGTTTDVVINSGATNMPTISAANITIRSLTVNSGATLTTTTAKTLTVSSLA